MRKSKLIGKILGIALVFVMIGSMLGGLASIANIVSADDSNSVSEDAFNYQGENVLNPAQLADEENDVVIHVQRYAKRYPNEKHADEYNISPALIMGIIKQESNFNPNAIGDGGLAIGYMQLHWDAAYDAGYRSARGDSKDYAKEDWPTDGLDPDTNIKYGCGYLKRCYDKHKDSAVYGDPLKNTISAYNLGWPHGPDKSNENSYVNPILRYYEDYKDKYVPHNHLNRDRTIQIAETYRAHEWTPTEEKNKFHETCPKCGKPMDTPDRDYHTTWEEWKGWKFKETNISVPYQWGGFSSLSGLGLTPEEDFDDQYRSKGRFNFVHYAGDIDDTCGDWGCECRHACGVDCSGFVSRCWNLPRHYSGSELVDISYKLESSGYLEKGDMLRQPGHVMLFEEFIDGKTKVMVYEASGYDWKVSEWKHTISGLEPYSYFKYRIDILKPVQSSPTFAGPYNNPNNITLEVEVKTKTNNAPSPGLAKDKFEVEIGGESTAFTLSEGTPGKYIFDVLPPKQDTEGKYDIKVILFDTSKIGQPLDILDIEQEAIHYTTYIPTKHLDIILDTDRSGSMGGQRIIDAKNAATLFVDLLESQDRVGLVSFSRSATLDLHLTSNFEDAKNVINRYSAGGSTNMGDALNKSIQELKTNGRDDAIWSIIYFTDGWTNTGLTKDQILSTLVPQAVDAGIIIYTLGYGSGADEDFLKQVAEATGGKYYFAPDSAKLMEVYIELSQKTKGMEKVAEFTGSVSPGETKTETFWLKLKVRFMKIFLFWPGSDLDLRLIDPSGNEVVLGPKVIYSGNDTLPEYYEIYDPQLGNWTIEVYGKEITSPVEEYCIMIFQPGALMHVKPTKWDVNYPLNRTMIFNVSEIAGNVNLTNVTFTASDLTGTIATSTVKSLMKSQAEAEEQGEKIATILSKVSTQSTHVIPTSGFSFTPNDFTVPAGESRDVYAVFTLPPGTLVGKYSGIIDVTSNDGKATIMVTVNVDYLPATVDFDPDTLNKKSEGKWVTVYTELPAGYNVTDINVSTMMLNEIVPAELQPTEVEDYDSDGIPDLMVKFDRQAVIDILPIGDAVNIIVTGRLTDGTSFEGSDVIRVIDQG